MSQVIDDATSAMNATLDDASTLLDDNVLTGASTIAGESEGGSRGRVRCRGARDGIEEAFRGVLALSKQVGRRHGTSRARAMPSSAYWQR